MSRREQFDAAEPVGRRFARLCFLAALVAAPWFRGAVLPGEQMWLALLLLAGVSLDAIFARADRVETPVPKIWWGLVAGMALALLQLLPLPPDTIEDLSPQAARWHHAQTLLEQAVSTPFEPQRLAVSSLAPVSIAPSLTRHEIAHLLLAAAAMLLATRLATQNRDGMWLLGSVALNGTCIALTGLWCKFGGSPFSEGFIFPNGWGPFYNRNNGAGYLLLCIASALGLLAWRFHERAGKTATVGAVPAKSTFRIRNGDHLMLGLVAALAVMIAAVLASLSRGATVALVVGFSTLGLCRLRSRAWMRGAVVAVVSVAVAAGILYGVGVLDAVSGRLATLADIEGLLRDGRVLNWRFGWAAAPEYLRLGSGLGTYRYAYRPFQDVAAEERFNYPENVFLQTLVEAGIPGFLLLTAMLLGAVLVAARLLRSSDARSRAWGVVAVFVLSSQAAHACADNGFYRPAGFLLFAALCGCFCSAASPVAGSSTHPATPVRESISPWSFSGRAASVFLLIGLAWAIVETAAAAPAGAVLTEVFSFRDDPSVRTKTVEGQLVRMENAVRLRPDDGELRRRTAEIYFAMYRRRAVEEIVASRGATDHLDVWNLATPSVIYDAAIRAEQNGDAETLAALRTRPAVMAALEPARRHLEFAARAAPLDAETWVYLGELHFLTGRPSDAEAFFRIAADLAPGRPALLFRIGLEAAAGGDEAFGFAALKRCWSLEPMFGARILAALEPKTDWSRLLQEVVPDSVAILEEMHAAMAREGAPSDRLDAIRGRIHRLELSAGEQNVGK